MSHSFGGLAVLQARSGFLSGGDGVAVQYGTVTTGTINTSSFEDVTIAAPGARGIALLRIKITRVSGSVSASQVKLYRGTPGVGVDLGIILGPGGVINPAGTDSEREGPQIYDNPHRAALPHTVDGETLNFRITNDGAGPGVLKLEAWWLILEASA